MVDFFADFDLFSGEFSGLIWSFSARFSEARVKFWSKLVSFRPKFKFFKNIFEDFFVKMTKFPVMLMIIFFYRGSDEG